MLEKRGPIGGKLHADKSMLTIMTDLTERLSVWVQAEVNRWMQLTILVFINFVSKVEVCHVNVFLMFYIRTLTCQLFSLNKYFSNAYYIHCSEWYIHS